MFTFSVRTSEWSNEPLQDGDYLKYNKLNKIWVFIKRSVNPKNKNKLLFGYLRLIPNAVCGWSWVTGTHTLHLQISGQVETSNEMQYGGNTLWGMLWEMLESVKLS